MEKKEKLVGIKLTKILVIFYFFYLASCTWSDEREFNRGLREVNQKNYRISLRHFENAIKYAPTSVWGIKSAREASRISQYEIKNYEKAIYFHRHLVLYSDNSEERIKSQKDIAYIYFDNLQNYQQAIIEFYKLLQMTKVDAEIAMYKLSIARANYYINNFDQAQNEINEISRLKIPEEIQFDVLILHGNVLVAQKQFQKAIFIYKEVLKRYPEQSAKENVNLTLAVCFEENNQFKESIDILEKLKLTYKPVEYIELRIKRLKERLKNQPGAKGLHRK